ncbi:arginase family protein [Streptomycetaceae bacterium NBC_01309]
MTAEAFVGEPLVLVVPQWQGSSVADPLPLAAGARRSAQLLRPDAPVEIDASGGGEPTAGERTASEPTAGEPTAGEPTAGGRDEAVEAGVAVRNAPALVRNAALVRAALATLATRAPDRPVVTLGGDCGVELEPVAATVARYGGDVAVVWFDAHGDLNAPAESPSGAFHGMVLRTLLGEGPADLLPPTDSRLTPEQVVLAGTRALDAAEEAYLARTGIRVVGTLDDPAAVTEAVAATGASRVYVHLDLDVFDPAEFSGLSYPEPNGATAEQVCAALRALTARFALVGLAVTEHEPAEEPQAAASDARILHDVFTAAGLATLLRDPAEAPN